MVAELVRLKLLLRQRHLQTYGTFRREYDKAALAIDDDLKGTAPSRAQLYRWLSGELKGLPYPYHCRVLEKMFPGWTAAQLFEHYDPQDLVTEPSRVEIAQLFDLIDTGLKEPGLTPPEWTAPDGLPDIGSAPRDTTADDWFPAPARPRR